MKDFLEQKWIESNYEAFENQTIKNFKIDEVKEKRELAYMIHDVKLILTQVEEDVKSLAQADEASIQVDTAKYLKVETIQVFKKSFGLRVIQLGMLDSLFSYLEFGDIQKIKHEGDLEEFQDKALKEIKFSQDKVNQKFSGDTKCNLQNAIGRALSEKVKGEDVGTVGKFLKNTHENATLPITFVVVDHQIVTNNNRGLYAHRLENLVPLRLIPICEKQGANIKGYKKIDLPGFDKNETLNKQ